MALREQLNEDIKTAMKAREQEKLGALRLLLSEVKRKEVDERITLDDTQVLAVLEKMLKQRKDSVTQYEAAAREDLAAVERYEIGVIQAYLPAPLSASEIEGIVARAIAESGATSAKDMGKVVGLIKPQLAGRADMGQVSALVKQTLGG